MINSSKQNSWAEDIKMRMEILLNGFKAKCKYIEDPNNKKIISKVENIIKCGSTNYVIDEYKSLTDEALVKMFDMSDTKFCKVFIMLFSTKNFLYEFQQKQRIEFQNKLEEIKAKYY